MSEQQLDRHPWCRDLSRDEAVRAAEDGRSGPLPTLEEAIAAVTKRRPPEPRGGGNVTGGLRTERVTLEITRPVFANYPTSAVHFQWQHLLRDVVKGERESVRVVDTRAQAVAESVAWEGARDAYRGRITRLTDERDAAIRERDKLRGEITSVLDRSEFASTELTRLRNRVAELESAPAASGAAGPEVVAWGVMSSGGVLATSIHRTDTEDMRSEHACDTTVVPLYAAPQPVWLTAEERAAIQWAISEGFDEEVLRNLLARSSPPEVVLPECPYDGYTMLTAEYVWCKCFAVFTEALAAAGVTAKEVGRE